jgi:hypothetical protein
VLDPALIGRVAAALQTDASFVEKDWHVIRAIRVISAVAQQGVTPVFSGGTSLAKGWGLIKRFSEDIDFKVGITAASASAMRKARSAYRQKIIAALAGQGFTIEGEPLVGNESQFFRASFGYGAIAQPGISLRPTLQIEMTFRPPMRPPTLRPLQSLLAQAERGPAEVSGFLCVDPVETAIDKLSALAWRAKVRDRTAAGDDPTIVRHIHDLAVLAPMTAADAAFPALVRDVLKHDLFRAKDASFDVVTVLQGLIPAIVGDPVWQHEYEQFVAQMSYARADEIVDFAAAVATCQSLVDRVLAS